MSENYSLFDRKPLKSKTRSVPVKDSSSSQKNSKKVNKISINKEIRTKLELSKNHIKILKNCKLENTAKELMAILEFTNLTKFRERYLNILLDEYSESLRDKNGNVVIKEKHDENGNIVTHTKKIDNELVELPVTYKVTIRQKGYGFFKMSKPDKPNAKDQKYIFTGLFNKIHIEK